MMKIIIGADVVPTKSNQKLFSDGLVEKLVGKEIISLLQTVDYVCFNLEAPLIDEGTRIKKHGASLKGLASSIKAIKELNTDLLFLSNNHIMDYGTEGLKNTISLIEENGLAHVGASIEKSWNSGTYVLIKNGLRIGFYNCCEHEFSVANNGIGAHPFTETDSYSIISDLSNMTDLVIVIYHGGKEYYRYPSPQLQNKCRRFIDNGASIVITQHSHCIGSFEHYNMGHIIYGQGNFIFDGANDEYWNTSLLIEVSVEGRGIFNVSYIPIKKNNECISIAVGDERNKILTDFQLRSKYLVQGDFVEDEFRKLSESLLDSYLISMGGYNDKFLPRVINKLTRGLFFDWVIKDIREKQMLRLLNYFECETHREMIIEGLKNRLYSE